MPVMTRNLPAAWYLLRCLPVPGRDTTANSTSDGCSNYDECNKARDEKGLSLQSTDPSFVRRHFCCVFISHCSVAGDSALQPVIARLISKAAQDYYRN